MSYIKRFVENNNVVSTEYGNLKYEVNQDDKTILMDSDTRQVLKDILVFDTSDFSRLDENVYVLFYEDKNEYEIFDILSYQPNRKWKYNEGGMIARTILQQLGGASRLKAMTGAYNFIDTGKGLSFRIKNAKANYIKITLNSLDLYNLEIGRIRGVDYKVVAEQNNIYADQLKGIIERVTGMYLSLAKGGEIEKSNNEMLQSQLKAVEHHAKELSNIVTNKTPIEAWVVGKIERAATDLSDITHYLDGAKFERGGEVMAKGLEWEDNLYLTHPILNQFLDDSELYYGFTNNEMIEFIKKLNSLGYDCDVYSKNTDIIFNPNKKQKKGTTDLYVGFQPINIRLKKMADGGLIGKKVKVGFRKEVGIVKDYDDDFVTIYYPDLGFTEKVNLKMEDVTVLEMAMGGMLKAKLVHKEFGVEYYKNGSLIHPTKDEKLKWEVFGLPNDIEKIEESFETTVDEFIGKTKKEIQSKSDDNFNSGKYDYLGHNPNLNLIFDGEMMAMGGEVKKGDMVEILSNGMKAKINKVFENRRGVKMVDLKIEGTNVKSQIYGIDDVKKMAMGGKVTFNDKVKAIEKNLVGKKVPTKYKRQYGQKYNEKEAHEAATKIAGSIVKK
jgi:hypothetical protein